MNNQIIMSLSCSKAETEDIINNINSILLGELKGQRENLLFIELNDEKIIFNNWFVYAILMIGTEAVANAINNAINDKEVTLKFIDESLKSEIYSLEFGTRNKNSLINSFSDDSLTKKEIAENFIAEIRHNNLKQQLSEMFTKKLWVRNFTREKLKDIDVKSDLLYKEKEFSLNDVKKLSAFLYPINETLKDNKKPIIREHIRRLILAESAINKEVSPILLDSIFDISKSKKKQFGITRRIGGWALNKVTFGLSSALFVGSNYADDDSEIG